uniref:CSON011880 protein n=1 Tax=Culicoides sonorensis TaxID=179676 RepID=A0A336LJE3_CULSO
GWNSWNTSNLSLGTKPPGNIWNMADMVDYHQYKPSGYEADILEAHRASETVIEDMFIRKMAFNLVKISNEIRPIGSLILNRNIHVTAVCNKIKAGRYRKSPRGDMPLTYEMANPPHFIGVRK